LLDWSEPEPTAQISYWKDHGDPGLPRLSKKEASATPIPFRDVLIEIAKSANKYARESARAGKGG
jgi:hypothetical protein